MTRPKFQSLGEIAAATAEAKARSLKVVYCHGVFDLLHLGHLRYLAAAKAHGDLLVVTVTADRFVDKGPGRPAFSASQRAEMIAALDLVDLVGVNEAPTAVEAIGAIKPDFYVKGSDYKSDELDPTGNIAKEKAALISVGGSFVTTDEETFSSSSLINDFLSPHDPTVMDWLTTFKAGTSEHDVQQVIDGFRSLRVLVLGEAIIDEYMMCEALGKSSKDPVLAFREVHLEQQLGGSLAIAQHCAALGAIVTVGCHLGEDADVADLLHQKLGDRVELRALTTDSDSTLRKRRFVDEGSLQRVFETYRMIPQEADNPDTLEFISALVAERFDVVLVCDYGHGFFSESVVQAVSECSQLLSVNTQSNAGNRGFNTIGKYPRADFVCLNGGELSLELRRRHLLAEEMVPSIQQQLSAKSVIVTEGAAGVLIYSPQKVVTRVPAFAPFVRDRVGAGDALFATTSLTQTLGTSAEITGLLGNLAGAAAVSQLGNHEPVSAGNLSRHVASLLK